MNTGVEGFRFSLMLGVLGWSADKSELHNYLLSGLQKRLVVGLAEM